MRSRLAEGGVQLGKFREVERGGRMKRKEGADGIA